MFGKKKKPQKEREPALTMRANIVYMMLGTEMEPEVQLGLLPGFSRPTADAAGPLRDMASVYAASLTDLLTGYKQKSDRELRDAIAQCAQTHDIILTYLRRIGYRLVSEREAEDALEDFDRLEAETNARPEW